MRLNPLVALIVSIAGRTWIWQIVLGGGVVLLLTLIFGRFFCGLICPLGAAIDISDKIIFSKLKLKSRPHRPLQALKYVFLTVLIVLAIFGVTFPLFMDPISLITRFSAILVYPLLWVLGLDALHVGKAIGAIFNDDSLGFATIAVPAFYGMAGCALLFMAVLMGGLFDKRFYCQYICPSGALFGLLSRMARFSRTLKGEKCNSCLACAKLCPTHAINEKRPERTSTAECILCGVCTGNKKE
ncbi:MAG: 4Fe-4S binding protein [Chitinivibrionales bacterium]|nr:4Fe-4S binding protein [Chitinivibrionales bacterium]